uniref:Uncharacterized protein n=1 Tax=Oryza sativa subsp. japonica TaxID=39947 RepID=Q6ESM9_ORYSJ|nr:hypothetical protein [Oryza sativa Japonica Group]
MGFRTAFTMQHIKSLLDADVVESPRLPPLPCPRLPKLWHVGASLGGAAASYASDDHIEKQSQIDHERLSARLIIRARDA